jgi:uncharacterized protein YjbJ (UPF0337 family)
MPLAKENRGTKGIISMKLGTRDELKGRFQVMKGRVKEMAGQLSNNPDIQAKGRTETKAGKVQRGIDKTAEMREEFAPDLGKE